MRKVRSELSTLIQTDKELYYKEIKKSMEDFIAKKQKAKQQNLVLQ